MSEQAQQLRTYEYMPRWLFDVLSYTVRTSYLQVPQPWIQPTADGKYSIQKSRMFQKAELEFVLATIYLAFTLYLQLFTQHLYCIRYCK